MHPLVVVDTTFLRDSEVGHKKWQCQCRSHWIKVCADSIC